MHEWLWLIMFGAVFVLIFVGYPVAFSLGGAALISAFFGIQCGFFRTQTLLLYPERLFGLMENQTLLAVPFFVFMGTALQRSKLAEDLLHTIGLLFGPMRGGLALAVVFVGALLAAATGVVGASVVAMGMISLPIMLRYGYAPPLATGVVCASGTLGQIVPPSIVLVVLAERMEVPVGDVFHGAFVPGVMLASMFAIFVAVLAWLKPSLAPAIPREERPKDMRALMLRALKAMVPPLLLILIVLGSIFRGIATPTEAGALGALGTLILAAFNGRLTRSVIRETATETLRLSTMVMFLLIGASAFTLVFRLVGGDLAIKDLVTNIPGGIVGFLIVANLTVFILGFFIDFFEIAVILLPLFVPAAAELGMTSDDMVWFAVVLGMNLQTSFLTPPFGFSLFYLRGVAPKSVHTSAIYKGVVPFIGIQLIAMALVIIFPGLVTSAL
jgi:tripartite ATP-independent transporter DctM subunit